MESELVVQLVVVIDALETLGGLGGCLTTWPIHTHGLAGWLAGS